MSSIPSTSADTNYLVVQNPDDSVNIAPHPRHQEDLDRYKLLEEDLQRTNEWLEAADPALQEARQALAAIRFGTYIEDNRLYDELMAVQRNDPSRGRYELHRLREYDFSMQAGMNQAVNDMALIEREMNSLTGVGYRRRNFHSVELESRRHETPNENVPHTRPEVPRLNLFRANRNVTTQYL
jgi:hypothetical protein